MSISWSSMRKRLEEEMLCESLKGRIQYFATRYRKSHDSEGRVAILIDGEESFRSSFFEWSKIMYEKRKSGEFQNKPWGEIANEAMSEGGIDQYIFYNAYYEYMNQSIDKSLESDDAVVRLFAILDRRVGKRTLQILSTSINLQPTWLQFFYKLRMDAENISYVK